MSRKTKTLIDNLKFTTIGVGNARKAYKLRGSALMAMGSTNLTQFKKDQKFWLTELWSPYSKAVPRLYKTKPNAWVVEIQILEDLDLSV